MRPIRKKIKFDENSLNEFMQELYDDSHNIKAKIIRLFTKWETKVKEGGEIAALGDQIVKLIAAEAKNQDQKIMLLKYLKDIVMEKKTGIKQEEKDTGDISADERNALIKMVKDLQKDNKN